MDGLKVIDVSNQEEVNAVVHVEVKKKLFELPM